MYERPAEKQVFEQISSANHFSKLLRKTQGLKCGWRRRQRIYCQDEAIAAVVQAGADIFFTFKQFKCSDDCINLCIYRILEGLFNDLATA